MGIDTADVVELLVKALTEDINDSLERNPNHRLYITFDNFEKYYTDGKHNIVSDFITRVNQAKIFVFSQKQGCIPTPSDNSCYTLQTYTLGKFNPAEVKEFLIDCGIENPRRQKLIISFACNLPAALPVALSLYKEKSDISDISNIEGKVYNRLVSQNYVGEKFFWVYNKTAQ